MLSNNPGPAFSTAFRLPPRLAAKADESLIADDDRHFAAIGNALRGHIAELKRRLSQRRKAPAYGGSEAVERDVEIRQLSGRLHLLRRYGIDICLGRMVIEGEAEPVYIGRIGLRDNAGTQLLLDWRTPAARPFFAATRLHTMGVRSRRRYRWDRGDVVDYWDEVFSADSSLSTAAYDDESAFIASLGHSRSAHMRDVLGTIQADQDAIIRAESSGALVVDGGPGTGKTVVALHRAAYLLYSDPHIAHSGGILFVGPSARFLRYIDDILPGLGEEGVHLAALADMVRENTGMLRHDRPHAARLKQSLAIAEAIDAAVRFYEEPPTAPLEVTTPWGDVTMNAALWADAFAAVVPGTPHNDAYDDVRAATLEILRDQLGVAEESMDDVAAYLSRHGGLNRTLKKAWPLLRPADIIADLWSVPAYLRVSAPWMTDDDVAALQRPNPYEWTYEDLPLLDAARYRVGDPDRARNTRVRMAEEARHRADMDTVINDLIAADDSELQVMSMLRGDDMQRALAEEERANVDELAQLAGPFGHIIIDEAQELTEAQWLMIVRRCPSRQVTIVGDRAQARAGFFESWEERLERVGLHHVQVAPLHINYRTPEEVMNAAEPVIRRAYPGIEIPQSVRRSGEQVGYGRTTELKGILDHWVASHTSGTACVIAQNRPADTEGAYEGVVQFLRPEEAKGLECDLVIVLDPDSWGADVTAIVDRYVAMTRATRNLVILHE